MRKLFVTLVAAGALVSVGSLANRADAMTAGNPAGIRAALDDVAVTDQVHCRWGWLHHNWWNGRPHWDGCYHGGGRLLVAPRLFLGPRLHSGRSFGSTAVGITAVGITAVDITAVDIATRSRRCEMSCGRPQGRPFAFAARDPRHQAALAPA